MEKSYTLFIELQPEQTPDQLRSLLEKKGVKVLDVIPCGEKMMYNLDCSAELSKELEQMPGFIKLRHQMFKRL